MCSGQIYYYFSNFLHQIGPLIKPTGSPGTEGGLDSSPAKGCVVFRQRLPAGDSCFVLFSSDFLVNTSKVCLCTQSTKQTVQRDKRFTFNPSLHLPHTCHRRHLMWKAGQGQEVTRSQDAGVWGSACEQGPDEALTAPQLVRVRNVHFPGQPSQELDSRVYVLCIANKQGQEGDMNRRSVSCRWPVVATVPLSHRAMGAGARCTGT